MIQIRFLGRRFSCLSARFSGLPSIDCEIKTGDSLPVASCKKSLGMTSYGGIIRIRL